MSDRTLNSGGGAVFLGNITTGRDLTIHHITEIRQVTERLSSRCIDADTSDRLLSSLQALSGTAQFTEDYAKELNASVFSNDPLLERVSRECGSILSELKRLENSLGKNENGGRVFTASLNEDVVDIRSRLISLQIHLSSINNRKIAKDLHTIKEALTQLLKIHISSGSDDASSTRSFYTTLSTPQLMNNQTRSGSDETSSIRSFYTASWIPFVDRRMWHEIVEGAISGDSPSKVPNDTITGTTLRGSGNTSITTPLVSRIDIATEDLPADKTGVEWSRSVGDETGECLLTLGWFFWFAYADQSLILVTDGGGVKSYSTILIIAALMDEVLACEKRLEREFTHYPRTFNDFRPCHYFHKVYDYANGTSFRFSLAVVEYKCMLMDLVRILAIALSRLRMTVRETIAAFKPILHAMYANPRNFITLAPKYDHSNLEAALISMAQQYCKQHDQGLCSQLDKFQWNWADIDTYTAQWGDEVSYSEQEPDAPKHHGPEYHLCQTICLTTAKFSTGSETYLLRTYHHHYNPDFMPPWVVGRATTATPLFFKALEVIGPQNSFSLKDGGIRDNNPSYCAYNEAGSLWGDDVDPTLLLSIGAGQTSKNASHASRLGITSFRLAATLSKYAKKGLPKRKVIRYTEGQDTHTTMRVIAKGGHRWYKRFEVTHGLEEIEPDQWEAGGKTLETISTATEAYLSRPEADKSLFEYAAPGQMLKQTAEKLVRTRRARELEAMIEGGEKREQWEAFMGKHLPGEREFFQKYQESWDYALLGRKG
ncbi:patatin phospholipase a2-related [Pyrenophora seminiperda CCB06]|uniref:Patatin phospholipase a2-related n=1 Tax=Pyrenophora seminiperda CCB06 TaxID=1302712 RepID=A0A3M7MF44_9PLEO|nr:patatin phospholipase a2-related [Pyrenophora seminiperda CCB06]